MIVTLGGHGKIIVENYFYNYNTSPTLCAGHVLAERALFSFVVGDKLKKCIVL